MKIAILNDTHCGARDSADWMIDYQERFYDEVFFPYLKDNDIKCILHLGDYFDSRKNAASVKALASNRQHFIERMRSEGMVMDLVLGNHDVFFKNTNDVNSPNVLLEEPKFIEVIEEPVTVTIGDTRICLIPWINSENYDACISEINNTDAKVCMGHFEFAGFPFQKGGIPAPEGLSTEIVKRFELVLSGHYHTKSNRGNIRYLGSQMQFTWADADDPKHFHIYDTSNNKITEVENPIRLFNKVEVFPETSIKQKDLEFLKGSFVQLIRQPEVTDTKFNNIVKKIETVALDVKIIEQEVDTDVEVDMSKVTNTPDLIKEYVDEIDTEMNKTIVQAMMETLHNTALQL